MTRVQLAAVCLTVAAGSFLVGHACGKAESDVERALYVGAVVLVTAWVALKARQPVTGGGVPAVANVVQLVPRQAGRAA